MDKRPQLYYPPMYPGSQPQYHPTMPTQTYPPPIYYMPMGSFPYQYPPYPSQYYYKNPSVGGSFGPRTTYNKPRRLSNQGGSKSSYVPKSAATKPSQAVENPEGKVAQRLNPEAREGCNERTFSDSLKNARFFIIKSYEKEHIKEAIRSGFWTSTQKGNQKLNEAYQEAKKEHPIILFFSVNNSGFFQGVAEMSSEVFFDKYYEGWNQPKKWMGVIDIKWLFLKDVVNKSLKHISNPLNEGKPIPNSRDTQEIPFDAGIQVLKIFEEAVNESKFLSEVLKRD